MPSCGTSFHTFWTRALCPGCGWRWAQTQCPRCGEVSQHEHWYRDPESNDEMNKEGKEITA
jgi:predicted amidophosphoribosyltransferase